MTVLMDVREVNERLAEIPQVLEGLGSSSSALARFLGIDKSSLSKTFKGERKLAAAEAIQIADYITGLETTGPATEPAQKFERIANGVSRGAAPTIPLYGFAGAGSMDRIDLKRGREIEFIAPPGVGAPAAELLALRVPTDHLAPRFRAGERVYAVRNLPPASGKDCVVEFTDSTATLRTFLGQSPDGYRFEYWTLTGEGRAALKTETVATDHVLALHQVSDR